MGHTLGSAICSQTAQCLRLILLLQFFIFFDKFNQMDVAEFVPVLEQKWSLDLQLCFFFFIFFLICSGGYHRDKKDVEHFIKQKTQTFCRGKILHDIWCPLDTLEFFCRHFISCKTSGTKGKPIRTINCQQSTLFV